MNRVSVFCADFHTTENGPRLGPAHQLYTLTEGDTIQRARVRFPRSPLLALHERLNSFPDRL